MSDQKAPVGLSQKATAAFLSAIADIIAEILPQDGRSESLQELKKVLREKLDRRLATVRMSDRPLNPIESAEVDVLLETFLGAFDLAYTNRQKNRGGGLAH